MFNFHSLLYRIKFRNILKDAVAEKLQHFNVVNLFAIARNKTTLTMITVIMLITTSNFPIHYALVLQYREPL